MIKVSNIRKAFGKNVVLSAVTFALKEGEFVGLVGPSGGGKSVLLKIIGAVMPADSGEIVYHAQTDGNEYQALERDDFHIGFLFQEGALFDSMSVLENVAFPLLSSENALHILRDEAFYRSAEMLDAVGLAQALKKHPGQLSGGMRRRVAIARALVANPQLVLLDDPTGGLDPVAASTIVNLLKDLHARYAPTIVMVSHDIRRLLPNVGRVLGLFHGRIACDLATKQIPTLAPPDVVRFLATRYDFQGEGGKSLC